MPNTLPTLDEMKGMELTAYGLYSAEIRRLPHLSRQETAALIERARQGDKPAREQLVLTCQTYAFLKAMAIYRKRLPQHLDLLDLVGTANLTLVEQLETGLTKDNPVAYLLTVARKVIHRECTYHAPLIQKPRQTFARLKRYQWYKEVSLDAPVFRENRELLLVDMCASPTQDLDEAKFTHRFAPLYEAVKSLPRVQRATIIRMYGFFGQPAETATEMIRSEGSMTRSGINSNAYHARRNLHRLLEPYLSRMLFPKPEPEEEAVCR